MRNLGLPLTNLKLVLWNFFFSSTREDVNRAITSIIALLLLLRGFCHRVAGLVVCPAHLGGSVADTLVWLDNAGEMSAKCLLVLSVGVFFVLMDLPVAGLVELAKMAGVVCGADHACSVRSTWWLRRLVAGVPFVACVVDLPCTFNRYLDMSSLRFCFMIWIVVFWNFSRLSPVGLFCGCCGMSLL